MNAGLLTLLIVLLVVVVLILIVAFALLPDFMRYRRIRSM